MRLLIFLLEVVLLWCSVFGQETAQPVVQYAQPVAQYAQPTVGVQNVTTESAQIEEPSLRRELLDIKNAISNLDGKISMLESNAQVSLALFTLLNTLLAMSSWMRLI